MTARWPWTPSPADGRTWCRFGKAFIANPDLVRRLREDLPLNALLGPQTFYGGDAHGYTDYPTFDEVRLAEASAGLTSGGQTPGGAAASVTIGWQETPAPPSLAGPPEFEPLQTTDLSRRALLAAGALAPAASALAAGTTADPGDEAHWAKVAALFDTPPAGVITARERPVRGHGALDPRRLRRAHGPGEPRDHALQPAGR